MQHKNTPSEKTPKKATQPKTPKEAARSTPLRARYTKPKADESAIVSDKEEVGTLDVYKSTVTVDVIPSWVAVWNKYHYCFCIAKGGFGSILLVKDKQDGALILVKETKSSFVGVKEIVHRLDHPNVLVSTRKPLMIVDPQNPAMWVLMEWQAGGSLFDLTNNIGRPLLESEAKEIMRQIVDGCAYLEALQLCHGDIKLGNFVLTIDGCVQLIDLQSMEQIGSPRASSCIKTPLYAAPEQYKDGIYSSKADVFSLAKCISILISGDAEPNGFVGSIWKVVSAELIECLTQSLDADPNERPSFTDIKEGYLKDAQPCPDIVVALLAEASRCQHQKKPEPEPETDPKLKPEPVPVPAFTGIPKVCEGDQFVFARSITMQVKVSRIVFGYHCKEFESSELLQSYLDTVNNLYLSDDVTSRVAKQRSAWSSSFLPDAKQRVVMFHALLLEHWPRTADPHRHQIFVLKNQVAVWRETDIQEIGCQLAQLKKLLHHLSTAMDSWG